MSTVFARLPLMITGLLLADLKEPPPSFGTIGHREHPQKSIPPNLLDFLPNRFQLTAILVPIFHFIYVC
jgi:hypothetical protein